MWTFASFYDEPSFRQTEKRDASGGRMGSEMRDLCTIFRRAHCLTHCASEPSEHSETHRPPVDG